MELNLGELLKELTVVLLGLLLFTNMVLQLKKAREACRLDYLNNVLNQKNISTFVLTRRFLFAVMPKPFPKVLEENVKNFSYRHVLQELDKVEKTTNKVNFTLGIIIFVLACVLGIGYPETIKAIFSSQ